MPPTIRPPLHFPTRCLQSSLHRPPLSIRQAFLPRPLRFSTHPPRPSPRPPREQDLPRNPLDPLAAHRLEAEKRVYYTRRSYYAAAGAVLCMVAMVALVSTYEIPSKPDRNDSPPGGRRPEYERREAPVGGVTGGLEVRKAGLGLAEDAGTAAPKQEEVEQVPTGTSTVPFFPRTITLPTSTTTTSPALPAGIGAADATYQLVGLGIRTVSFLRVEVYVVGLYVAVSDIAALQAQLVRHAASTPGASTLVAGEREKLREMLLDAEGSARVWDELLREGAVRSVWRIVPTRNTDMAHLRDGWVRGITARSQGRSKGEGAQERFEDEGFGNAVGEFKAVFSGAGRRSVGTGKVLMLERTGEGGLRAWVEGEGEGEGGFWKLGDVKDERVGRLVWMGYLAGKNVASEGARRSVVDGVMEFVERPVGTVETQVHV
ncbi:Altered inheritance of mitochondria protein 18 mitochondrial [Trapelia coarctata]|nr:Altered inheritance of mitochondria protein 18 mitochondrial [Trapelia coarctata]